VSRIDQYALQQFIDHGHFERHLNRMRTLYGERRDAMISAIKTYDTQSKIQIIGANSGLHLILKVNNGMSEHQLVDTASTYDIQIHKLSDFYFNQRLTSQPTPAVILGYAHIAREQILEGIQLLFKHWNL
jgi:GntR family transcriptional regulator/MocR family aminotransferase